MICNIILLSLLIIAMIVFSFIFSSMIDLKKGYEEVLAKIMTDHESLVTVQKNILKEFKNKIEDIQKIQKDINTIRTGLKNTSDILNNKIKSSVDKK